MSAICDLTKNGKVVLLAYRRRFFFQTWWGPSSPSFPSCSLFVSLPIFVHSPFSNPLPCSISNRLGARAGGSFKTVLIHFCFSFISVRAQSPTYLCTVFRCNLLIIRGLHFGSIEPIFCCSRNTMASVASSVVVSVTTVAKFH